MFWGWEGQVCNKRCRRSKTRLDEIKEGVFLDFISLTNGVNRLSSIERSNDIIRALLYPWRDLVNGGPGHCRPARWTSKYRTRFETGLISHWLPFSLGNDRFISDWNLQADFNIWEFPDWIADFFLDIWDARRLHFSARFRIYLLAGKHSNKRGSSIFLRYTQKLRFLDSRDRKDVRTFPESWSEIMCHNSRKFVASFSRNAIVILPIWWPSTQANSGQIIITRILWRIWSFQ